MYTKYIQSLITAYGFNIRHKHIIQAAYSLHGGGGDRVSQCDGDILPGFSGGGSFPDRSASHGG